MSPFSQNSIAKTEKSCYTIHELNSFAGVCRMYRLKREAGARPAQDRYCERCREIGKRVRYATGLGREGGRVGASQETCPHEHDGSLRHPGYPFSRGLRSRRMGLRHAVRSPYFLYKDAFI